MNLKQMEAFLLVAQLKSFTKAANMLAMSQPAISSQIKALENDLQITLFERDERKVVLTEAGRLLYPEVSQIVRNYHKIRASLDELKGLKTGHLSLGANCIAGEYLLPPLIGSFREEHPGVKISLHVGKSDTVIQWLKNREVDLGIVGNTGYERPIQFTPWLKDSLVIITSPWHPWANKKVSLKELIQEPFIIREPGSTERTLLENNLGDYNISLDEFSAVLEFGSAQAILNAVRTGLGIGVVSWWAASIWLELKQLAEVNISGINLNYNFYVASNAQKQENQSTTLNAFQNFIFNKNICRRILQAQNSPV